MPRGLVTDWERIERLHNAGMSAPKIAKEVGCTLRTVQRWRQRAGVSKAPSSPFMGIPISEERLEVARRMVADHASLREIHRSTGIRIQRLARLFPDAAWTPQQGAELAVAVRWFNRLENNINTRSGRREA